jgi:hypothetical protein
MAGRSSLDCARVPQTLMIGRVGGSEPQAWLVLWTRGQERSYGSLGLHPPSPAVRLRPTPRRQGSGCAPKTDIVDKGAYTRRLGYAHPTACAGPPPQPEPRALSFAIASRSAGVRPPRRPRSGGAGRPLRPWRRRGRPLVFAAAWDGSELAGRLNPAPGLRPCAPHGLGLQPRG